ncbi:MAG: PilZ domain-containing protein [Granulosicoccaceae bacterium]|jgi:hypothetical protein
MQSDVPDKQAERRVFPRIPAQCPVRFRDSRARRWLIGRLVNFSATGLLMIAPRALAIGDTVAVQLERGSRRDIPPLAGEGSVVRCMETGVDQFQVAVKILRFAPQTG